jgi:aspartate 4-decarboxylase
VVTIDQSEMAGDRHSWQYPDSEIAKLEDPKIKAFFVVNPGNPASCAMRQQTIDKIAAIVRGKRPHLLILTDDVYGTFVPGFRSLAAELPQNTILVYSYSKFFGCTGWRLGVVALHEDNVIDKMLAKQPEAEKQELRRRYGPMTLEPDKLKFIDRMVADSRDVALNHTAGLSLPQQAQMSLFSLFSLLDDKHEYKLRARAIINERFTKLFEGLGVPVVDDPLRAGYYANLDIEAWGIATFGETFRDYLNNHHDPLEIVIALAKRHGTVLLNGSGFKGPPWSARVSLANLSAEEYADVGKDLRAIAEKAVAAWRAGGGPAKGGGGNGNPAAKSPPSGQPAKGPPKKV